MRYDKCDWVVIIKDYLNEPHYSQYIGRALPILNCKFNINNASYRLPIPKHHIKKTISRSNIYNTDDRNEDGTYSYWRTDELRLATKKEKKEGMLRFAVQEL